MMSESATSLHALSTTCKCKNTGGNEELPEVDIAHPLWVEATDDGQGLLGVRVPDVDWGDLANLAGGNDALKLGVLIDSEADDVICVLQVETLISWKWMGHFRSTFFWTNNLFRIQEQAFCNSSRTENFWYIPGLQNAKCHAFITDWAIIAIFLTNRID